MKNFFYKPRHGTSKHPEGFTLIETLIAITIITFAVVGPFQIVQGVLGIAYNSRDQIIAAGLAQEAMEYVREVRDSNYLTNVRGGGPVNWLFGFDGSLGSPNCYTGPCVVDPGNSSTPLVLGQSVISCGGTSCASRPLHLDSASTYRYNQQTNGNPTKFTRSVQLTQISPNETLVTVTVTWENHGTKTIILKEYLQNWL